VSSFFFAATIRLDLGSNVVNEKTLPNEMDVLGGLEVFLIEITKFAIEENERTLFGFLLIERFSRFSVPQRIFRSAIRNA